MITNPENLPKDRLKAELKKRRIVFNTNENKKYYVDLYRKKILNPDPVRSEFSDDDVGSSPGLSKRKVGVANGHNSNADCCYTLVSYSPLVCANLRRNLNWSSLKT